MVMTRLIHGAPHRGVTEHYLLQVQILTAMSTILNVAVVQIHYRGEHRWKMPTWAKRLVHHSIGHRLKITPHVKRTNKEEKVRRYLRRDRWSCSGAGRMMQYHHPVESCIKLYRW